MLLSNLDRNFHCNANYKQGVPKARILGVNDYDYRDFFLYKKKFLDKDCTASAERFKVPSQALDGYVEMLLLQY